MTIESKFKKCGISAHKVGAAIGYGGVMYVLTVSPAGALKLIEECGNKNNRKLVKTNIDCIIEEINSGRWQNNGECITFNKKGILSNGHHRLMAIANSKKTIKILAMTGVQADVYDGGKLRTLKDQMKMGDLGSSIIKNAPSLA